MPPLLGGDGVARIEGLEDDDVSEEFRQHRLEFEHRADRDGRARQLLRLARQQALAEAVPIALDDGHHHLIGVGVQGAGDPRMSVALMRSPALRIDPSRERHANLLA